MFVVGMSMNDSTVEPVKNMGAPKYEATLTSFLGLVDHTMEL